jgi:hypothetical protein
MNFRGITIVSLAFSLGSTARATQVAPITLEPVQSTVFNMSQSADLWFFNGANPANYATSITLNAAGPQTGAFSWEVVQNLRAIKFENGSGAIAKASPAVDMTSSEISLLRDDVGIAFRYNGQDVGTYQLSVFAAQRVTKTNEESKPATDIDGNTGFQTLVTYTILDHFGNELDKAIEQFETFDDAARQDNVDNTWPIPFIQPGTRVGITDKYMMLTHLGRFPDPLGFPVANSYKVYSVPQHYFLGTTDDSSGTGRQVEFHTLQWYIDHAEPQK